MSEVRVGVLTVSDQGSKGQRVDTAGARLKEKMISLGFKIERYEIVPDERDIIAAKLCDWSDNDDLDLILTTGGTGFAPRDVTPEATLAVIHKQAPGIAETMRAEGFKKTPSAILSRAVAGIRGNTLIINLPGSERGATESIESVIPALKHAIDVLRGRPGH